MSDTELTLTLRRPVAATAYSETGAASGPELPAGTTATMHELVPGSIPVANHSYAEVDHRALLLAAATVPCAHLDEDQDDTLNGASWFCCALFTDSLEAATTCRGDRTRCPLTQPQITQLEQGHPFFREHNMEASKK